MTDLDALPFHDPDESPPVRNGATGRPKCKRHDYEGTMFTDEPKCIRCGQPQDLDASRRGRSNRNRGNRAELAVARMIPGARKMGPLGLPWDVEVGAYARLQVKKLAHRPSLAAIARLIRAIPDTGDRLRGFVWVEAAGQGKRGEVVVWFDWAEWVQWHGWREPVGPALVTLPLAEWVAEFVEGTP